MSSSHFRTVEINLGMTCKVVSIKVNKLVMHNGL